MDARLAKKKLVQICGKGVSAEKTFMDCSLVPPKDATTPKENFRKEPQNLEIHKSFLPRKFSH